MKAGSLSHHTSSAEMAVAELSDGTVPSRPAGHRYGCVRVGSARITRAGTDTFLDTVPEHRQARMVGTLIVK
jgi:hypothetical protein